MEIKNLFKNKPEKRTFMQNLKEKLMGFNSLYGMVSFLEGVTFTSEQLWNGFMNDQVPSKYFVAVVEKKKSAKKRKR